MASSTLFSLDAEPFKPAEDRTQPVVWIKRLVILSNLDSSKSSVIRDIEFRRGLNIIKTKQMKVQGGPVAGHSVGKTLLMRMIRYSLGEPTFGTEQTQDALLKTKGLKRVVAVTHWCVAGTDWIVVRPLQVVGADESYCEMNSRWQDVIDSPQQRQPHRVFVDAVNDSVVSELPDFTLARGRDAKWQDVLAWLSRDYQCGYRKANDWRHEDSNTGASLDRDENSSVMQWVMGLLTPDEIALRLKHTSLLRKRADTKRTAEREQQRLKTLWEPLRERLKLPDDTPLEGDQKSFDSSTPTHVAKEKLKSLRRLRKERIAESQVEELRSKLTEARNTAADALATVREHGAEIKLLTKQIGEYEADPLKPYARCRARDCWMKQRAKRNAHDPARDDHLSDLRSQLDDAKSNLKSAKRTASKRNRNVQTAESGLEAEEERLAKELSGIDQDIGRWRALDKEATKFETLASKVRQRNSSLKRADRKIENSRETLDEARKKHYRKLRRLSDVYEHILKEIFGPEARGKVRADGNGLQPVPDPRLAPTGAALSVMTTVLAFDVSSLAASVSGIGQHPRLLLHDSPREGDMEGPLFRRLFEIVFELESLFADTDDISFQYIVTTTSNPPTRLAKKPYVIETLDATNDAGRLMRKRF